MEFLMRTAVISHVLLFGLLSQSGCSRSDSSLKIIGGEDVTNPGFFAGLVHEGENQPFCGASFISERILVTAAHCVAYTNDRLEILPAISNMEVGNVVRISVKAAVMHPLWNEETLTNDIALLFIDEKAVLPKGITVAAYQEESRAELPERLDLMGWGDISTHGLLQPGNLQGVTVQTIPWESCSKLDGYGRVTSNQFCSSGGDAGGKDSCYGDSGGPAFSADGFNGVKLYGLISWGKACAQSGKPGVLTRISSYSGWITETIGTVLTDDSSFARASTCYDRFTDAYSFSDGYNSITMENYVRPDPWSIQEDSDNSRGASALTGCP
ncbi:MAG: serine protease, partial [Pseudobdellovibrionaceae bacterium]|nr:serine protease [Pseudobdellovibrionaceae bacterium]